MYLVGVTCAACALSCHDAASVADGGAGEPPTEFRGVATAPPPPAPSVASIPVIDAPAADAAPPDRSPARRALLEQKVFNGQASVPEIRLLIALSKQANDAECVERARRATPRPDSN